MNLILYTKTGCPWCVEVLELFKEKGVIFEERDCRKNEKFLIELQERSGQSLTPTLDCDGELLADSDAKAITEFLTQKGHPSFI